MSGHLLKFASLVIVLLILKACVSPSKTTKAIRVTAEVETPQGVRAGSSIIEIVSESVPKWLPGSSGSTSHLKGESPVVDLGNGKRLFLLLEDEHGSHNVMSLFGITQRKPDNSLNVDDYPVFVTFTDPDDAASVVKVSPEDFSFVFGGGHNLRRILVEPVSDPPTFGALEEIPLFRNYIL